jgi:hypothetical protein
MGKEKGVYRVLVGKPEGRWEDTIRMDLQEVGLWTGLGWLKIETGGDQL